MPSVILSFLGGWWEAGKCCDSELWGREEEGARVVVVRSLLKNTVMKSSCNPLPPILVTELSMSGSHFFLTKDDATFSSWVRALRESQHRQTGEPLMVPSHLLSPACTPRNTAREHLRCVLRETGPSRTKTFPLSSLLYPEMPPG